MGKTLLQKMDEIMSLLTQLREEQKEMAATIRRQGAEIQNLIILTSSFTSSINLVAIRDSGILPPDPSQVPLPPFNPEE